MTKSKQTNIPKTKTLNITTKNRHNMATNNRRPKKPKYIWMMELENDPRDKNTKNKPQTENSDMVKKNRHKKII